MFVKEPAGKTIFYVGEPSFSGIFFSPEIPLLTESTMLSPSHHTQ
jgi:hypothetical protein